MVNKFVLVGATLIICMCIAATTGKSEGIHKKNKSRSKLLLQVRSDASNFEFYPFSGAGQDARKHLLKLDSPSYVFPEPGCACVPRIEDCDFECCYCELNCPLPKSTWLAGDWLSSFYGKNGCKSRRGDETYGRISGRDRRAVAWRKMWNFCDKPDYFLNAQAITFPFICVHSDKSYTSLHYSMTPSRPNLLRMTNLTPVKYTWPSAQRFYNKCLPPENTGKDEGNLEKSIDKYYHLLLQARQLFYLEPPSSKIMSRPKGQLSHDKLCLSQRKNVDEIITFHKKDGQELPYPQDTLEILDQAIRHLGQRKTNYFANFKVKLKKMPESCQQYRNDLVQVSKFWLQKFSSFAQVNQSRNITMRALKKENLSQKKNWQSEGSTERFPEKCPNIVAGMEVRVFFSREHVFEIAHQIFTHDVAAKSSPPFFIQIKSLSPTKMISGELSRFWSDFLLYECPDQFCWRDIFDFSYLLADTLVIILVFLAVVILSTLLFTKVGFFYVF